MIRSFPALVLSLIACLLPAGASAVEPVNQSLFGNVAIEGTDPVAYFTEGRAVEGKPEFSIEWRGANWRFASAEHRDLFQASPEKYAPQYGGYCAYAVSQGGTAGIDPQAWTIVDGRLYLNLSPKIQKRWEAKRAEHIAQADENWPRLLAE